MDTSEYRSTLPLVGFNLKSLTLLEAVDEIAKVAAVRFNANAETIANIDTFVIFRNFMRILL